MAKAKGRQTNTIETSIGRVMLCVACGDTNDPQMVNVTIYGDRATWLHCTVARHRGGWRVDSCFFKMNGEERPLGDALERELVTLAARWAAENPHLFVENDREAFYGSLESYTDMVNEALEAMPSTDKEIAPVLSGRLAQLAKPAAIKAAQRGIETLGRAITLAREARQYFKVAAEGR